MGKHLHVVINLLNNDTGNGLLEEIVSMLVNGSR